MLQTQIKSDMVTAMKAREALKVEVLRGLMSSCTNELVSLKRLPTEELSDQEVLAVIRREVKKRKDAFEQFTKGNRPELAQKEEAERVMLEAYLPAMMSQDDIRKIAEAKKAEMGVTDKKEAGKFMGALMKDLQGKADGTDVKAVIDSLFN
ncbi:MAG: GatB/YqeY domain-containing protein [Candidatus Pacebacteria bacterium]|nr:GatB/YqeY domain-containing protein [Candidatus Paceibacterota bacterium]MBP9832003.1 GatB/YqeY domain-containing protein [Candidatus Paceibacterota bacterium]